MSLFKKKVTPLAPAGHPIFLLIGSLSGCSKKDALQYARGLAEQNIITPSAGRLHVFHDKARDRWVYEVHEGGIEFSIAEKVIAALDAGEKVNIALVNEAYLTVEEAHGELFSLVNPKVEPEPVPFTVGPAAAPLDLLAETTPPAYEDISKYAGKSPLLELFPMNTSLSRAGVWLVGVSGVLFTLLGLGFALVKAGTFDSDNLLTLAKSGVVADASDNPAMQLEKARNEAAKTGVTINALKKGPKGWSWELSQ